MNQPFSEVTEDSIIILVDSFYAAIRRHPRLGPVFTAAIAADDWPAHMNKMYAFWSSVMLKSGRYKGNPVAVHQAVAGIEPALFDVWLDLFDATAAALFVPEITADFAVRARQIGESLKLALFFRPDRPWPDDLRTRVGQAPRAG